jgi:hypothetical protein
LPNFSLNPKSFFPKSLEKIMLKLLQITSFILLAASIAGSGYLLVNRPRPDADVRAFLENPLTAETYKGNLPSAAGGEGSTPPLVAQAQALSLRLNPPAPKIERPTNNMPSMPQGMPSAPARPQKPVIAKFDLLGTCVNHDRPELSMIYINIPGEGRKWVYQGETVGRLQIENVKSNSVVYTDGGEERELAMVDQPSEIKSLLKSDQQNGAAQVPSASAAGSFTLPETGTARPAPTVRGQLPSAAANPRTVQRPTSEPVTPPDPAKQKEQIESSLEMLSNMKTGSEETDQQLSEAMKKMEEMMKNAEKLEAMQKAAEGARDTE